MAHNERFGTTSVTSRPPPGTRWGLGHLGAFRGGSGISAQFMGATYLRRTRGSGDIRARLHDQRAPLDGKDGGCWGWTDRISTVQSKQNIDLLITLVIDRFHPKK